jgi:hypothetical protein
MAIVYKVVTGPFTDPTDGKEYYLSGWEGTIKNPYLVMRYYINRKALARRKKLGIFCFKQLSLAKQWYEGGYGKSILEAETIGSIISVPRFASVNGAGYFIRTIKKSHYHNYHFYTDSKRTYPPNNPLDETYNRQRNLFGAVNYPGIIPLRVVVERNDHEI